MAIPVSVQLLAEIGQFQGAMAKARAEMASVEASGKSSFAALASVGGIALGAIAGAVAGVGVLSIRMAGDFQSAMLLIRTQAGASTAEVDKMSAAIIKLAPQVAASPLELAKALYPIESIGLRDAAAMDVLKFAAEGAAVGHAKLADTANALASVMASGITGIHGAAEAMGVLNGIVGNGKMYMQDLASAMGSGILSTAQTFGVSLQSVGAAMDVLTNAGMPAEQATTRLRMTIALMAAPTKMSAGILKDLGLSESEAAYQTNAMMEALHKSGVSITQLASDMRQPDGLFVALSDLKAHMTAAGLSAEEQGATIARAFGGGRQGAGIMALYGNLDGLKSRFDAINTTAGSFGGAFAATTQTLNYQIKQVWATIETWLVQIGTRLIPYVEKAIVQIKEWGHWLSQHQQIVKDVAIAVGVLLVPAVMAFAVAMGVAAVNSIIALAPMYLLMAAVAALAAGIYYLWTHWDQVWQWIMAHKAYAAVIALLFPVGAAIVALVGIAKWLYTNWDQVWTGAQQVIATVWAYVKPVWDLMVVGFGLIAAAAKAMFSVWELGWAVVRLAVSIAWGIVGPIFKLIVSQGVDAIKAAIQVLQTVWNAIWPSLSHAVSAAFSAVKPIVDSIITVIGGIAAAAQHGIDLINSLNATHPAPSPGLQTGGGPGQNAPGVGHMAGGGPFMAGQTSWVGELGPELVTFGTAGVVHPHGSTGGTTTIVNLTVQGSLIGAMSLTEAADILRRQLLRDHPQGRIGLA